MINAIELKEKLEKLNELIKDSYDIAQKNNHIFTYNEAKTYDPLIRTLFKSLLLSDELNNEV